jgi:hypothetical protein
MKCAICFSGAVRTFPQCYSSIVEHIFKPLEQHNIEYDIFCHFWRDTDNRDVIEKLRPKKYLEEKQFNFVLPEFCKGLRFYTGRFKRVRKYISYNILQYYGIERSFSLPDKSYDYAIRLRYDDYFSQPINIAELTSGDLWVGTGHLFLLNRVPTNINDSYAFGTFTQMRKYSLYYVFIPEILRTIKNNKLPAKYSYIYNAVALTLLFRYYLLECAKLTPKYTNQKYGLYRSDNSITYYGVGEYSYKGKEF